MPQSYDAKFNVRIVPGHAIRGGIAALSSCEPRGHRKGWDPVRSALRSELVGKLAKADKAVMTWLARDAGNGQRFLNTPVAALREAGVQLERAEEKALARMATAAADARVVPPGVNVLAVSAQAFPNGRVGNLGATRPPGKGDGFDCGPKRKG